MTSKNLFWTNILDQLKHKIWFFLLCTLAALASGVFGIFLNVYTIENYNYMSTAEIREEIGLTDTLLRFSVGIENCEDIIRDLDHMLSFA